MIQIDKLRFFHLKQLPIALQPMVALICRHATFTTWLCTNSVFRHRCRKRLLLYSNDLGLRCSDPTAKVKLMVWMEFPQRLLYIALEHSRNALVSLNEKLSCSIKAYLIQLMQST